MAINKHKRIASGSTLNFRQTMWLSERLKIVDNAQKYLFLFGVLVNMRFCRQCIVCYLPAIYHFKTSCYGELLHTDFSIICQCRHTTNWISRSCVLNFLMQLLSNKSCLYKHTPLCLLFGLPTNFWFIVFQLL